jgi:hypothetical protein
LVHSDTHTNTPQGNMEEEVIFQPGKMLEGLLEEVSKRGG